MIDINRPLYTPTKVGELQAGWCFVYDNTHYLVTNAQEVVRKENKAKVTIYTAVNLVSGHLRKFREDIEVLQTVLYLRTKG